MSSLTYTDHHCAPTAEAEQAPAPKRKSFFSRVYDAIVASGQRRADREIAAYLERRGDTLTDDMEREIMRRMSGQSRRI